MLPSRTAPKFYVYAVTRWDLYAYGDDRGRLELIETHAFLDPAN